MDGQTVKGNHRVKFIKRGEIMCDLKINTFLFSSMTNSLTDKVKHVFSGSSILNSRPDNHIYPIARFTNRTDRVNYIVASLLKTFMYLCPQ